MELMKNVLNASNIMNPKITNVNQYLYKQIYF